MSSLFVMLIWSRWVIDQVHGAATCEEAYLEGSRSTGVKLLEVDGYKFKAFCQFNNDSTGYFFPSRDAIQNNETFKLNLEHQYSYRDHAVVRVILENGNQRDSVVEQITQYSSRNITVMLNSCDGFTCPVNQATLGKKFLFLGFLDRYTAAQKTKQGWKSNGRDIDFMNCDANPNSYFAFYPDVTTQQVRGLGTNYDTTSIWRSTLRGIEQQNKIPSEVMDDFIFMVEIHMGGCGVHEVSLDWKNKLQNPVSSKGAALGLKFDMKDDCYDHNKCGSKGTCVDGVNTFTCICDENWHGNFCDMPKVSDQDGSQGSNSTNKTAIAVGVCILILVIIAMVITVAVLLYRRRKKMQQPKPNMKEQQHPTLTTTNSNDYARLETPKQDPNMPTNEYQGLSVKQYVNECSPNQEYYNCDNKNPKRQLSENNYYEGVGFVEYSNPTGNELNVKENCEGDIDENTYAEVI